MRLPSWLMRLSRLGRSDLRAPDPQRYPAGPVRDLAVAGWPPDGTPAHEVDYLVVDLETTGLDPETDHVLSIGWVPVRRGEVVLAEATEVTVAVPPGVDVGDSAVVHGLTDDLLASARSIEEVLPLLLAALRGHVLVAHHAPMELGFLGRAVEDVWGSSWPVTAVDTLALHRELLEREQGPGPAVDLPRGSLRLDAARRRFGLPRYRAHHALVDAIAAAELLLAQLAEMRHRRGAEPTFGDLQPVRHR